MNDLAIDACRLLLAAQSGDEWDSAGLEAAVKMARRATANAERNEYRDQWPNTGKEYRDSFKLRFAAAHEEEAGEMEPERWDGQS